MKNLQGYGMTFAGTVKYLLSAPQPLPSRKREKEASTCPLPHVLATSFRAPEQKEQPLHSRGRGRTRDDVGTPTRARVLALH